MFAKPIAILGLVLSLHDSRGAELLLVASSNGETQGLINTINWALGIVPDPPVMGNGSATDIGPTLATIGGAVTVYFGTSDGGTDLMAWDDSMFLDLRTPWFGRPRVRVRWMSGVAE